MEHFETSRRWGGWFYGAILLPAFVAPLVAAIQARVFIKMAPSLGLLLYVIVLVAVNRTLFTIGPEGISVRYGPLPTGLRAFRLERREIAMVYVRRTEVRRHLSVIATRAAGVSLSNGYWVDIGAASEVAAEAKAVGAEVVQALGWTQGVVSVEGRAPRVGMVARRAVFPLAGALGLCWLWASYH